jgi:hypothetical protein
MYTVRPRFGWSRMKPCKICEGGVTISRLWDRELTSWDWLGKREDMKGMTGRSVVGK